MLSDLVLRSVNISMPKPNRPLIFLQPNLILQSQWMILPELLNILPCFSQLKEWRNIKAREMALPHYMILPQKTMVNLANFMPQSLRALKLVKGMGTKKSEKFGEELLDIIISYCKKENIEPPVETITKKKIQKRLRRIQRK